MNPAPFHIRSWREAFTLIELLVVVAIMVLIAAFAAPAFNQMARTASLTTAGEQFVDALNMARQTAITRNARVEVRLFEIPSLINSADIACRAYQISLINPDTGNLQPLTNVVRFQEPVIFAESKNVTLLNSTVASGGTASTILFPVQWSAVAGGTGGYVSTTDTNNTQAMCPVPGLPSALQNQYQYASFDFLPTGETNLDANGPPVTSGSTTGWMGTLIMENTPVLPTTNLPANFVTVWIDPSTGKVTVFRP